MGAAAGGASGGASGNPTGGSGGMPVPEPPIEACVTGAVNLGLPVGQVGFRRNDFELVPLHSAVAVLRRRVDSATVVKTYMVDGMAIAAAELDQTARLVSTPDKQMVLVTDTGQTLAGHSWEPTLPERPPSFSIPASETEELLGALDTESGVVALTSERFVNLTTGVTNDWSTVLAGAFDPDPPSSSHRLFGMGSAGDRILALYGQLGASSTLLVTPSGELIDYAGGGVGNGDYENTLAVQFGDGLVVVGSNQVLLSRINFDLSRPALGVGLVQNLQPFYRETPSYALAPYKDRLLGVWFAVTPPADYHQGSNPNQVYVCELDLSAVEPRCSRYFLIAAVDFDAYDIAYQPIAATVVDESTLAVVHADMGGRTWLRFLDLECAFPPITE
jgi:hypothetical protein